jgi:hypothetical protein
MADYVLEGPKWGAASPGAGGGTVYWSFANPANGHKFYDWDSSITGEFQTEVERAFADWQSVANIQFVEVPDSPDVNIRLGFDAIDGTGNIAGETQYSFGSDNRLQAVEIRFDSNEGWHLQNGVEVSSLNSGFFVVALHEIGHALGLGHYNATPAVMNAVLNSSITDLTQSDKDGIAALYGDTTPPAEPQSTLPVAVGGMATVSTAFLLSTDNVSGPDAVTYRIAQAPTHGTLLLDGVAASSFTQSDIDAGHVQYSQTGDAARNGVAVNGVAVNGVAATSDGFTFTVSDAAGNTIGPEPFAIAIVDTTDPVAAGTDSGTCPAGGDLVIWKDALCTVALGDDPADMVYSIVRAPAHGALVIDGQPASSFTQADIDDRRLDYIQRGGADSDSFSFVVTDASGKQTASQSFHILIQDGIAAAASINDPAAVDLANSAIPAASLNPSAEWSDDSAAVASGDAAFAIYLEPWQKCEAAGDGIGS